MAMKNPGRSTVQLSKPPSSTACSTRHLLARCCANSGVGEINGGSLLSSNMAVPRVVVAMTWLTPVSRARRTVRWVRRGAASKSSRFAV